MVGRVGARSSLLLLSAGLPGALQEPAALCCPAQVWQAQLTSPGKAQQPGLPVRPHTCTCGTALRRPAAVGRATRVLATRMLAVVEAMAPGFPRLEVGERGERGPSGGVHNKLRACIQSGWETIRGTARAGVRPASGGQVVGRCRGGQALPSSYLVSKGSCQDVCKYPGAQATG